MKKIVLIIFAWSIATNAVAQDKTDTLPEVLVITPFSSSIKSPLTITNIGRKELSRKHYGQEPSAILSQTPSVTFYTDAGNSAGYSYFRIRGIDQTRINMSLNGVPLNEPEDQGVYFSNYPDFLTSVSAVQIQRGAGYSRNGVAAYGGSLYFESLLFKDSAQRQLSAGYGSFNAYRINGSLNTGLRNNTGLYASASHLHSDGYKDHSGNTSSSFFLSTGYWGEKHKLYIVSFAGHQRNGLAWIGAPMDSIRKNPSFNANSTLEDDAFTQAHIQLHHEVQLNKKNQLHSGVFYNYLSGNYDLDLNNFLGLPPGNELYNYAFRSHFTGLFAYHSFISNRIRWHNGVQQQFYSRTHTGSEQTQGKLYSNTGYRNESSLFTKAIATAGNWNILGDLQYRHSSFTYTGREKMPGQFWNFLNGTVGITYFINNKLQVYYSIGQTHREPTRNDLFMGNDDLSRDSYGELLFNPVKPERATGQELGIKWFNERGHIYGNIYHMDFRNEITLNGQIGPTGLPLHSSAASSSRSGIELDALYRFKNGIELKNQSAVSYNRIKEEGVQLRPVLAPAFIINQEIRLVRKSWQTGIALRYQSNSYIDYANTIKLPEYFIINWDGGIAIGRMTVFVVINNITNRQYFTNGLITATGNAGYFIQAPVNFHTGIQFNW